MLRMPVAMARQTFIVKIFATINTNSKLIFQNRISHVNFVTSNIRLKSDNKVLMHIPEKPKKPHSAYIKFLMEKRPDILNQNPSLKNHDVVRKISEQWSVLTPEVKEKYEEAAKDEKEKYDDEMVKYNAKLTPEQEKLLQQMKAEKQEDKKKRKMKRELKVTGRPKRPITSFGLFVQEHLIPGESMTERLKDLKTKWSQLSEVEKEKYQILYKRNKEEFDRELYKWEEKMMKEGKSHLVRVKTLKKHMSLEDKINLAKPQ